MASQDEAKTAPTSAPATEAIEPAVDNVPLDDDEFAASDFDPDTLSSASTSIRSSIFEHSYENGRRYHKYKTGRYPIPNDDAEQNRDEMKHALMLELTDGKLFYSPIGTHPQKILDLATGTGGWAIDAADMFPGAEVLGTDLSPIQPTWVPPNCSFIIDDLSDEWLNGKDWDFVHMRCIFPALKQPAKVLSDVHENLKPGGWLEVQELDGHIHCDDGTMTARSAAVQIYDLIHEALGRFGMDFRVGGDMQKLLEDAGFVNVKCIVKRAPIGIWAKDPTLRLVGHYMLLTWKGLLEAMAAKPLKMLDISDDGITVLKASAVKEAENPRIHMYTKYMFWMAQKKPND